MNVIEKLHYTPIFFVNVTLFHDQARHGLISRRVFFRTTVFIDVRPNVKETFHELLFMNPEGFRTKTFQQKEGGA